VVRFLSCLVNQGRSLSEEDAEVDGERGAGEGEGRKVIRPRRRVLAIKVLRQVGLRKARGGRNREFESVLRFHRIYLAHIRERGRAVWI
jgi:hypothetical protein